MLDCPRLSSLRAMSVDRHLKRLERVWADAPCYFITVCVAGRRSLLASDAVHAVLREEWTQMRARHGWAIGRYVVMPDHVHFMTSPENEAGKRLSVAVGRWKEWTSKRLARERALAAPLWQAEFFDHVLRSDESRAAKWSYIAQNPVRAGLVAQAEEWPFAGAIDFE